MGRVRAIEVSGGLESIVRYSIAVWAEKVTPVNFLRGTLAANLPGFLLMGFLLFRFIIR